MKIGVPAATSDLEAQVGRRLGTSAFLLIVDAETMAFEGVQRPTAGPARGVGMVVTALQKEVDVMLTGYVSPRLATTLRENGVEVVTGVRGTVRAAIIDYLGAEPTEREAPASPRPIASALARSSHQLTVMLPTLGGVVLLIGLFKTCVSKESLSTLFSGELITDTLRAGSLGSILAGNAVNSYVIGKGLLDAGVGLAAVTAFILTWVSVGLVQLPMEVQALGARFALARTVTAFAFSIPVAVCTAYLVGIVA